MASPPSAAAAEMFHPPTIPDSDSCSETAGPRSGGTGGHATASAPRVAAGGAASGPPTRPSAASQSALSVLCGIET
eukprot:6214604-Pleurochrysis_carterae.AAC.2